jgi:hemolysin activation/secretion protein/AraC-like DNA-binding protein
MTIEKHLTPQELILPPGGEWTQTGPGWVLMSVISGQGYLLKRDSIRQFGAGDLLVLHQKWETTVRSSALGEVKLQIFCVQPQLLGGLLTLNEVRRFEDVPSNQPAEPAVFPAGEAPAQKSAEILRQHSADTAIDRCRRLQLWLEVLTTLYPTGSTALADTENLPLRERFRRILERVSAEELCSRPFADWAGQLGCSKRHWHRLFREEFGVPPRSYLKSLRLARARQFLAESDSKIINVAHQSGYNHLGLFNQLFKQQFGMTPGDWRRQARKKMVKPSKLSLSRKTLGLLALFWLLCGSLSAATNAPPPPPASSGTNSANSAPVATNAAVATPKFEVKQYIVEGNTILDQRTLDSLFAPAKGKEISFQQINQAITAVQKAYRDRGLVTVLVTLPQQKLTNATIRVKVVESPLAQISVVGNRYYSSNNIMSKLPSLHTNTLLNSHVLQRELDAANASRDRQIYTVLGPGPEPETSALTLRVKDRLPLHARLELDNDNTPGSPALRANFNTQYDNLWNADNQVGFQYSFTPEFMKYKTGEEQVPLDAPLIANYSAYYRMPIGQQPAVQDELEANPSRFGYNEATHQFQAPPVFGVPALTVYASRATTDSGVQYGPITQVVTNNPLLSINSQAPGENTTANDGFGSRFSLPLHNDGPVKFTLNCGFDFKEFHLASYNTNTFVETFTFTNSNGSVTTNFQVNSGQPTRAASVNYLPLNAGVDLEGLDKWGMNTLNLSANFNVLPVCSGDSHFADAAYSPDARADYVATRINYDRDEKIYGDWRMRMHAGGQWSPTPLISNEQFPVGGITSVRGYHEGEIYGDSGWNISLEPRTPLYEVAAIGVDDRSAACTMRLSTFFDYGQAYLTRAPAGTPGHFNLCGTGIAAALNIGQHLGAQMSLALPLISTSFTQAGSFHLNFSLSAQF